MSQLGRVKHWTELGSLSISAELGCCQRVNYAGIFKTRHGQRYIYQACEEQNISCVHAKRVSFDFRNSLRCQKVLAAGKDPGGRFGGYSRWVGAASDAGKQTPPRLWCYKVVIPLHCTIRVTTVTEIHSHTGSCASPFVKPLMT